MTINSFTINLYIILIKKILFLIVALGSLLTCLFYAFDSSFFQSSVNQEQEIKKEITRIGDSTHFLIFDTTYNAGIIVEESLVAEHIKNVLPNIFRRGTTDLNKVRASYKNDSLKLTAFLSGFTGMVMEIKVTQNEVESKAYLYDCTYHHDYKPLKSKIIINSKTLDFVDSLDVYFDMSFVYEEENGKYIDTMVVKGRTRMGKE